MTAPGWYQADGDPANTNRYWDGEVWVGDPVVVGPVSPAANAASPLASPSPSRSDQPSKRNLYQAEAGTRIGARVIDLIIQVVFLAVLVLSGVGGEAAFNPFGDSGGYSFRLNDKALDTGLEYVIFGLVVYAWNVAWTHLKGGTPGKLLLNLRIADATDRSVPVGLTQAALRSANILEFVLIGIALDLNEPVLLISLLVGLVSLILLFAHDQKRTIMDMVAKTVILRQA